MDAIDITLIGVYYIALLFAPVSILILAYAVWETR